VAAASSHCGSTKTIATGRAGAAFYTTTAAAESGAYYAKNGTGADSATCAEPLIGRPLTRGN
jgi:hypothetical protein